MGNDLRHIVIGRGWGSLQLTRAAVERLAALGHPLAAPALADNRDDWYVPPPNGEYPAELAIDRDDPLLVHVVRELGRAAATVPVRIVEIPADVAWEILDYDGKEWVAQKHRVWPTTRGGDDELDYLAEKGIEDFTGGPIGYHWVALLEDLLGELRAAGWVGRTLKVERVGGGLFVRTEPPFGDTMRAIVEARAPAFAATCRFCGEPKQAERDLCDVCEVQFGAN